MQPAHRPAGMRPRHAFFVAILVALAIAIGLWVSTDGPTPPPSTIPAPTQPSLATSAEPATSSTPGDLGEGRHRAAPAPAADEAAPAAAATAAASASEPSAATVYGRVVDTANRPVANAAVGLVAKSDLPEILTASLPAPSATERTTTTAADGSFTLTLPTLGAFTLRASHERHPPTTWHGEAVGARVDGIVLVLQEGLTVRGLVTGMPEDHGRLFAVAQPIDRDYGAAVGQTLGKALFDFGELLDDLEVPFDGRSSEVADDGSFELAGLAAGKRYRVFAQQRPLDRMPTRCTVVVEAPAGTQGLHLPWRASLALSLRVLDADTGAALEDLQVAVGPMRTMSVFGIDVGMPMRQDVPQRHFPGGVVQLTGIAVDTYAGARLSVAIRAHGHHSWHRDDVDATTPGARDLGTITLTTAPVLRVLVTSGGLPVAGATVEVRPAPEEPGDGAGSLQIGATVRAPSETTATTTVDGDDAQHRATTDAEGRCELTADLTGRVHLVVRSEAHCPTYGPAFELPARGVLAQEVVLARGGQVQVTAVDAAGSALAGALVVREGRDDDREEHTTASDGTATFAHVAPGPQTFTLQRGQNAGLRVMARGLSRAETSDRRTVEVTDGAELLLRLAEPRRGSLRGTITLDGQPLDRAEVQFAVGDAAPNAADAAIQAAVGGLLGGLLGDASAAPAQSDPDGSYSFQDVPLGPVRITVRHRGLAMAHSARCELHEGDNVHDVALRSTNVQGIVLDANGNAIVGAEVRVAVATQADATAAADEAAAMLGAMFGSSDTSVVRTDAEGRFVLRSVHAGVALQVRATARLHVPAAADVPAIAEGGTHDGLTLRLLAAGRVRVRAPGAMVLRAEWAGAGEPPAGPRQHELPLPKGRATFDQLAPGRWRLRAERTPDTASTERIVEVAAGRTDDIDL